MESVMNNFAGDHQLQEQVDWTAVLSGHCHDLWRAALLNPWPKTGEPAAQHAIFTMGKTWRCVKSTIMPFSKIHNIPRWS